MCSGTTKNSTAKITVGHGLIYGKTAKSFGESAARLYYEVNNMALDEYAKLSKSIDCEFKRADSYIYSMNDAEKIKIEVAAARRAGADAEFAGECKELPFKVAGAIKHRNQAQFDPIKFALGISEGLNVYENTFIRKVSGHTAFYERGEMRAKKIVIASHFPFIDSKGFIL